mgnify:FL=1
MAYISLQLVQGLPLHSSWRKQEGDICYLPQSDDRIYLYRILAWRGPVLYCVGNVLRLPAGGGTAVFKAAAGVSAGGGQLYLYVFCNRGGMDHVPGGFADPGTYAA